MLFPTNKQEIPAFIEDLKKLNSSQRNDMLSKLVASKNDYMVEILLAALQVVGPDRWYEKLSFKAATYLGKLGDEVALNPLLEILESEVPIETRTSTASALSQLRDSRALETLLLGLNDPIEDIRIMSAIALSDLKDVRAVEPLIQLLNRSSDYEASIVASCLTELGDGRAFETVLESLNRCSGRDYCDIVESLSDLNDPRVFDTLMEFSKFPDWDVQIAAVRGLQWLADPRAIPRLEWFVENAKFSDNDLGIPMKQYALDAIKSIRREELEKSKINRNNSLATNNK